MFTLVKVPCDYEVHNSYVCSTFKKGIVLICGELGLFPPKDIVCPKCLGTGEIEKSVEEINKEIDSLKEDIQLINNQISVLEGYVLSGRIKCG